MRRPRWLPVLSIIAIALGLGPAHGCASGHPGAEAEHSEAGVSAPVADSPPVPRGPRPAVYLSGAQGESRVAVEVVSTPAATQRGLMYRQHLPPDDGMLFLMEERKVQSFWMHNTLIPLDMIFIDRDLTVVGIVEQATPLTEDSRDVGKPSVYVLEVNGGWSKQHGVGAGSKVRFENVRNHAGVDPLTLQR
jgi:uncharacterized membrane protein (UPF0127 family)